MLLNSTWNHLNCEQTNELIWKCYLQTICLQIIIHNKVWYVTKLNKQIKPNHVIAYCLFKIVL